jgi:RHS repeat-associated protein
VLASLMVSLLGFAPLPAAAQDAAQCGTQWDCVSFQVYPAYYWARADHCDHWAGSDLPPPVPANVARWYQADNGYESGNDAAALGYNLEHCVIALDRHLPICRDDGIAAGGPWIVDLYWHNPDVIALAHQPWYWYFNVTGADGNCPPTDTDMYYEIAQGQGYGCPQDDSWTARVDSSGNRFCYRPRKICCTLGGGAPPTQLGNPINIYGGKRETEVDYRGPTLVFVRNYDSARTAPAFPGTVSTTPAPRLGTGWRSKYDRRIDTGVFSGVTTIAITREDDDPHFFKMNGGAITGNPEEQGSLQQVGSAWRYTTKDDAFEDYDATGRLTAITERSGATQTLAYNAQGQLISVTDSFGRQLSFTYDAAGHIQTMTDPRAGTYSYAYDTDNNLISVTYPDASVRDYFYNEQSLTAGSTLFNALTGIADENGTRFASFAYDATGRALQTMHHASTSVVVDQYSLSFTSNTQRTVTDPRGTTRTITLETVGGLSRVTGLSDACPACQGGTIASAAYNANNVVSSNLDFNNRKTCYAYDLTRNLETARVQGLLFTEDCSSALASPPNRPDVRKVSTTWNATYRLPATITEPAAGGTRTTTFTYDASGNLTQKTIVAPKNDGSGGNTTRTWSWTYTTLGRVLTATDPNSNVTTTTYYSDSDSDLGKRGNVATISNALGHVTQITAYDGNRNPTTIVDPNGLTTTLAYDARNRLTSRNVGGEVTSYTYDGVGQLTRVTQPDGSYLAYTYDGAHRLTQIQDGLGNKIVYTLDAMGNRTQEQAYDPFNNLARTRSRTFDTLNRLAQDIGATSQTTNYAYDNNGNLTTTTDPLNHATGNSYDALNRLTSVLDPASGTTTYTYDAAGNLTSVTDPRNIGTSYTFDGLGNVIQQVSPDTGTTSSIYDAAGNVVTRTDARGVTATYSYDALNRATQIVYTKSGATTETHIFEYDGGVSGATNAKGHLTKLTDTAGVTSWTYTPQGRVASKTQLIGSLAENINYTYNSAGQLNNIAFGTGLPISYSYLNNRVAGITATSTSGTTTLLSSAITMPFGPVAAWQWGNGLYTFRNFDGDGRLTSWDFRSDVSVLRNNLHYDAAGRIDALTDPAQAALTQGFSYDALDRLLQANTGSPVAHTQQFTYDGVGNRLSTTLDSAATTLSYPSTSNRLSSLSGATTRSYAYDNGGNPTIIGARAYTYNLANRLTQVAGGPTTATYAINALGQRVAKTVGTTTTYFAYDEQGHLLGEYDSAGNLIQQTVWLDDLPVAVAVAGSGSSSPSVNVALASNGGVATASSSGSLNSEQTSPSAVIDDVRSGDSTFYWHDGTLDAYPDWVQINFSGSKTINRVVVYAITDDLAPAGRAPASTTTSGRTTRVAVRGGNGRKTALADPTNDDSCVAEAPQEFTVEGWNGSSWVTLATVTDNNLCVRDLSFTPFTTDRIRINITMGGSHGSTIGEVEAWTVAGSSGSMGGLNYVHADHLGTPRAVSRPSDNAILWRWDNVDPFGANQPNENPSGLGTFSYNLRFPGQYYDAETGTHYNYYRDYDPSIGRYIESDPVGLLGGTNTYGYVGASPIRLSDPRGLMSDEDCCNAPGAKGNLPDSAGGVVCCNGRKVPCVWEKPGFNGREARITRQCKLEHEEAHLPQVTCPSCGVSRGHFTPGQDQDAGECVAHKAQLACLRRSAVLCGNDKGCNLLVQAEIQIVQDRVATYCGAAAK